MRVKGIAYEVATYEVVALKTDLATAYDRVGTDLPHFRLQIEPEFLSADERRQATIALRHVLGILRGYGENDEDPCPELSRIGRVNHPLEMPMP